MGQIVKRGEPRLIALEIKRASRGKISPDTNYIRALLRGDVKSAPMMAEIEKARMNLAEAAKKAATA